MAVPHGKRFEIPFEVVSPQGAYLISDVQPMAEATEKRPVLFCSTVAGLRAVDAPLTGRGGGTATLTTSEGKVAA